jgi:hypothetical protein
VARRHARALQHTCGIPSRAASGYDPRMRTPPIARPLAMSLLGLLFLDGCYGTPDSFIRRASKLDCVRLKECNEDIFEEQFHGEMDECRDSFKDFAEQAFDDAEAAGCEYDADKGRDCIHTAYENRKDCSEDASAQISEDCADVLDCPGAQQVEPDDDATVVDSLMASVPPETQPED